MAQVKKPVKKKSTHRYECVPVDDGVTEFTFVGLDGTEISVPRLAFIPADQLTDLNMEDDQDLHQLLTSIAGEDTANYVNSLPLVYMQQFFEAWNADSEDLLGK